jgi:hypothetical protein
LNAELNPICHLLALLGTHHILYVSRIRDKKEALFSEKLENSFQIARSLCPHYHNINRLCCIFSLNYTIQHYVGSVGVKGRRRAQKINN